MKKFSEKDVYREKIIEIIKKIENEKYILFIYTMLKQFQKEWGI